MGTSRSTLLLLAGLMCFTSLNLRAQEEQPEPRHILNIQAETRLGWQRSADGKTSIKDDTGFRGRYLNLKLSGDIAKNLSWSYRQRLNRIFRDESFFDATDYLYINWNPGNWTLSAGKQVVLIGGYEYDRPPIDLYLCSEYWNNIACYQFGVSAGYNFGNDVLTFQVCHSPNMGRQQNTYAYNLYWTGTHGFWKPIWSANLIEHTNGKYIGYLALGNRFQMARGLSLEFDFMDRFTSVEELAFKDFSIIGELAYRPIDMVNVFIKGSYDYNGSETSPDFCVRPGTDMFFGSAGVEVYPVQGRDILRLYAAGGMCFGKQNEHGVLSDRYNKIEFGLRLKLGLLDWKKKNQ